MRPLSYRDAEKMHAQAPLNFTLTSSEKDKRRALHATTNVQLK
jgi:hypothetical protein